MQVTQRVPIAYQCTIHNSCVCNELHSLLRRHLTKRESGFNQRYMRRCFKVALPHILPKEHVQKSTYSQIIDRYVGSKKRLYQRALRNLFMQPRERAWATISMFVKSERIPLGDLDDKAPRAIQFRKPEFNLLAQCYLHPIEMAIYNNPGPLGLRMVAKGLNNLQRAALLLEAIGMFLDPKVIGLDHHKYDSYNRAEHLRLLHKLYLMIIRDPYLAYLLHFQINNRCFSKEGLHYNIFGTRMSGDPDTGLGNTALNLILIMSWLLLAGIRKFYIMVDGDDAVLVVERSEFAKLNTEHFWKCGFSTEITEFDGLNNIEFCRSRLLMLDPPRFAREPWRALTHMATSIKFFHNKGKERYLAGIGLGELAASNGVPIIMPIALAMSKLSDKPILDDCALVGYGDVGDIINITDDARMAFWHAWRISPQEQIEIERSYTPKLHSRLFDWFCTLPIRCPEASLL